jgi:hypothetical protein
MSKIQINLSQPNPKLSAPKLDTLGQLRKGLISKGCGCENPLQKRSLKKALTLACLIGNGNGLVDVKGSKLISRYWSTHHCGDVIFQDGQRIRSTYCKRRWCGVCNSIRTATLIKGYSDVLGDFKDPYLVTLSLRNVKAEDLEPTIRYMTSKLARVRQKLKKRGYNLQGIRNHECTYNVDRDDFHPHMHMIVEGEDEAHLMRMEWLSSVPESGWKGQDVRPADKETIMEVFKYVSKVIVKGKDGNPIHYPKAMDVIYNAYNKKRVIQPFGIKKAVIEEKESGNGVHDYLPIRETEIFIYETSAMDWVSASGEVLSEYTPTKKVLDLVNHIRTNHEK